MADIAVERSGPDTFRVTVSDAESTTTHEVAASDAVIDRLGGGSAEAVVEAAFRFLLDREPKEAIMSRFDLMVIGRFFADFPAALSDYLDHE